MPEHDLSLLVVLAIAMILVGIFTTVIFAWIIVRQAGHNARDLSHDVQEVAQMHREVAFMIRRQYGDIDRDLQEIKELLGGQ